MASYSISIWDPTRDNEPDNLSATASSRIRRDLMNFIIDPPNGIHAFGDERNLKFVHAIIIGPEGTPYQGGFFYFLIKCPNDYPIAPPRMKLMTTDAGRVLFNPNFYQDGKICVSILGTWEGPGWSPVQQLSSLCLTVQSLMTEHPYFNEPVLRQDKPKDVNLYDEYVRFHTLRAAVCGMLENDCHLNMPLQLRKIIEETFLENYTSYVKIAEANLYRDGMPVVNPFAMDNEFCFNYKNLLAKMANIRKKLIAAEEGIVVET